MGGIVDHSSNMPNLVALLSAEADYNEGCIAFMAASHLRMLLCELENVSEETMEPVTIYFDSKSMIAMSKLQRHKTHTPHHASISLRQGKYFSKTMCIQMDKQ
jgi:hypothetical protein